MEEEKTDSDKEVEEENSDKYAKKSYLNTIILIISVLAVLALLLMIPKIFGPKSLDDMTKEIIQKGETKDGYLYNGFVFIYQEDLWHTRWQLGDTILSLHFHYGPRDVEYVPMIGMLDNKTDTSKFYITFDPLEENISLIALASSELGLNLVKGMNVQITAACTQNETEGCANREIITCDNTNESVIFVKTDDITNVLLDKNCITIKGPGNELLKAVDKFLFRSYKIIERDS